MRQATLVVTAVVLTSAAVPALAQSWVERTAGPGEGDSGAGGGAIVEREMLNLPKSGVNGPAGELVYNHPSMLCETRKGTLVFMWNGGAAEGEGGNRTWITQHVAQAKPR